MPWYAAKASNAARARRYLGQAGIDCFCPETHRHRKNPRTGKQEVVISATIPGYVFVSCATQADAARASHSLGVSSVLGHWRGSEWIYEAMPEGWIEALIAAGPVVIGKAKSFKRGEKVRAIIAGVTEIIGRIDRVSKHMVRIDTGAAIIDARPEIVETCG